MFHIFHLWWIRRPCYSRLLYIVGIPHLRWLSNRSQNILSCVSFQDKRDEIVSHTAYKHNMSLFVVSILFFLLCARIGCLWSSSRTYTHNSFVTNWQKPTMTTKRICFVKYHCTRLEADIWTILNDYCARVVPQTTSKHIMEKSKVSGNVQWCPIMAVLTWYNLIHRLWSKSNQCGGWSRYINMPNFRPFCVLDLQTVSRYPTFGLFYPAKMASKWGKSSDKKTKNKI